jgi:hypothetical protein
MASDKLCIQSLFSLKLVVRKAYILKLTPIRADSFQERVRKNLVCIVAIS